MAGSQSLPPDFLCSPPPDRIRSTSSSTRPPLPQFLSIRKFRWAVSVASRRNLLIDEPTLIYADQPYLNNQAAISYTENLEGFDQNTGIIGPQDDLSPLRNFGVIRQSLYMITGTGLHETQDNGQTEPGGWSVNQIADNCGVFSVAS